MKMILKAEKELDLWKFNGIIVKMLILFEKTHKVPRNIVCLFYLINLYLSTKIVHTLYNQISHMEYINEVQRTVSL